MIDWFTVAAQIVNFVVLVALMKRFLYGPLVRAIDAREQRIESQMAQADEKNKAAEQKTQQVQKEIAEMDSGRAQMIAEARSEAERQRNELIQKARDSVRTLEERWRADLRLRKESLLQRNPASSGDADSGDDAARAGRSGGRGYRALRDPDVSRKVAGLLTVRI